MAKSNLQKHGTYIRHANKTSEDYFSPVSAVPGAGLFLGIDRASTPMVEPDNSNYTSGYTLLADPPYYYANAFRYPNINICVWYSHWFYNIS